eukprot:CAMPEP_0172482930 /NCGR_PEP_ID=MMETSP1066-20121228/9656_1 /TAXON_ID=671091 /ORGANISM="Coscinodiscus wailesii, Strain CCMP2513" /LENGTH=376 /DNA_ID=CAMNT_0013246475 /DNA_START=86 /DNA_END=1213 /DNA_ORIENTATION=+
MPPPPPPPQQQQPAPSSSSSSVSSPLTSTLLTHRAASPHHTLSTYNNLLLHANASCLTFTSPSTLRTHATRRSRVATSPITCLTTVVRPPTTTVVITGHANGALSVWEDEDEEVIWVERGEDALRDVTGCYLPSSSSSSPNVGSLTIVTVSSTGTRHHTASQKSPPHLLDRRTSTTCLFYTVRDKCYVAVGVARPAVIDLYSVSDDDNIKKMASLTGHEDWITSLSFHPTSHYLASGSQDCRIRLWHCHDDETASSEAVLIGHDDAVTDVSWYDSRADDDDDKSLLSSSLDKSILLWREDHSDGVWTPTLRVGSAGGVLGGSLGSSLLGFVRVSSFRDVIVGMGYGGVIYLWQSADGRLRDCLTGHFEGVVDMSWE